MALHRTAIRLRSVAAGGPHSVSAQEDACMMFVGLDKTTWEFINSFSHWFSAIGTLAAVIALLYLARGQSRLKLHITAGHRVLAGLGTGKLPDYVYISLVNRRSGKARIAGIGWKIGLFKKSYAIQIPDKWPWSSSLPIELAQGREAQFLGARTARTNREPRRLPSWAPS